MKKAISILIVLAILVTAFAAVLPSGAVTHGFLRGDSNDDSKVTMKDVLLLRRYLAGVVQVKDIDLVASDVNADTKVTNKDILKLRRILADLDTYEENNSDGAYRISEIKIGGRNIARYSIVIPETVPSSEFFLASLEYSAGELQKYIKDACGIRLSIVHEDNINYNIKYVFDTEDEYDLGKEGFILRGEDNGDFSIICGTRRAALYATYTFLEDLVGYRFLTEGITYLYQNKTVNIADGYYDRQVPSAVYRAIGANNSGTNALMLKENASECGGYQASKDSTLKLGGAVGTTYLHAHSFAYYMAGFENRNDPDLNSLGGMTQPCMTKEETYDAIVDFMLKLYDWRVNDLGQVPGVNFTQLSCSANDNGNYCMCSNCKKIYQAEESVAGALIRLCNRVCERVLPECPGIEIYTAAYAGTHIPPKATRPDPRLCICFCSVGCNNHSLRNTEECDVCGGNRRLTTPTSYDGEEVPQTNGLWMGFLKDWLELTDNVWYWYYTDNWGFYMSPAANLFNFYDDIKYLNELGVKGYYLEGDADVINYSIEKLRIYLEERIMWDPEMTEEEYINYMNEYLMIYYGDGWENIREYIYLYDEAGDRAGCWTNNFDHPWNVLDKQYFADNYAHMEELIDAAYEAASDPVQKSRVELFSVHMHFLGLSATFSCREKAGGEEHYLENYNWLWNYFSTHPRTWTLNYGLGIGIEENVGAMVDFPTSRSDVRDTMSWLRRDLTGQR